MGQRGKCWKWGAPPPPILYIVHGIGSRTRLLGLGLWGIARGVDTFHQASFETETHALGAQSLSREENFLLHSKDVPAALEITDKEHASMPLLLLLLLLSPTPRGHFVVFAKAPPKLVGDGVHSYCTKYDNHIIHNFKIQNLSNV